MSSAVRASITTRAKAPVFVVSGEGFRVQLRTSARMLELYAQGTPGDRRCARMGRVARLRRSDCSGPGIRRRRRGKGFEYLDEHGRRVTEAHVLERIRELAIPPAWEDVWICSHPMGHIQATGTDAAGRKQYRYHDRWRERRDQEKFESMLRFAAALPQLRKRVTRDLALEGMPRDKALACAVRLMDRGFFRIGSEDYAEENDTYGIATMGKRHVTVTGDEITFDYEAKGSKRRVQEIGDPVVADVVRTLKKRRGGGEELLAYKTNGRWSDVKSPEINEYVKEAAGGDFSAKDFRTWSGTVLAAQALAVSAVVAAEGSKTSRKRAKTRAVNEVAHYLGNTPAVARASYIDPRVFDRFDGGLTIAGVLTQLAEDPDKKARAQRAIEEGVLDLIARDTGSDAVEKAAQVAKELEDVAA
jgi:DNA topoisomerase I